MAGMIEAYKDHPYRKDRQVVYELSDICEWPEFVAFARRIGIPLELSWKSLDLRIAVGEVATIKMEFVGMEPK